MYRDKHFTAYARKVAATDAGKKIGSSEAPGLPQTPDFDALKPAEAPPTPEDRARHAWIAPDSPYLDPERRNRDYGGYRPAIGKYADPASQGADWQGKTPPDGTAPKP